MANFFKPAIYNNMVAGLTAVAFTTAVLVPPQIHAAPGVNLDFGAITQSARKFQFKILYQKITCSNFA